MEDEYGEHVNAYDLSKVGGVRRSYQSLLNELKYHPAGKLYDLGFQAQLREARKRERRGLENKLFQE